MLEHLEHLILEAARHPRRPRTALYKELLRSQTFLIYVDAPLDGTDETRVSRLVNSFDIWADRDENLGGVWVPIFPSPEGLGRYVESRGLPVPPGREFLWMEHSPGRIFGLFDNVSCFAGLKLWLDESVSVSMPWPEVRALSEGKIPAGESKVYEAPVESLELPVEARPHLMSLLVGGDSRQVLWVAEAGPVEVEDLRRLARLKLEGGETALVPCRHLIQILKSFREGSENARYEELLRCFVEFEMYGEAEAFCGWLRRHGLEVFARRHLAEVSALRASREKFLPASSPGNFPGP